MPDITDIAAQDQAAQTGNTNSGRNEIATRPDINSESLDTQGFYYMRKNAIANLFNKVYEDPESAYDNNASLTSEDSELLPSNPSMIGKLKEGVQPDSETMRAIQDTGLADRNAPQPARNGDHDFREREAQYNAQSNEIGSKSLSPSESMNQELTRASTSVYQIGSI